MKRILALCLSAALLTGAVSVLSPVAAAAEEVGEQTVAATSDMPVPLDTDETEYEYKIDSDTYKYVILDDGTVKITEATCFSDNVYVPAAIDGKKVTVIGRSAFRNNIHFRFTYNDELLSDNMRSVTIPEGVKVIESYAFHKLDWVPEINLPDSLEQIGENAFYGTEAFENLVLPKSLKSIGCCAFGACTSITSVDFPDSLTEIRESAFSGCTGITSLEFPESLTSIGKYAFRECTGIKEISLPDNFESLGKEAFLDCESLEKITVSHNSRNFWTFDGVLYSKDRTELIAYPPAKTGDFIMPSSVKKVGECAFKKSKITGIRFCSQLESISAEAFYECTGLTGRLNLPENLYGIGSNAFWGCTGITELYMGKNLSYGVFAGSLTELKNIYVSFDNQFYTSVGGILFSKDMKQICGYPAGRTGEYIVPDGVEEIYERAFCCSKLTGVVMPDSLKTIRYAAFKSSAIQYAELSENLETIAEAAFEWCENLKYLIGMPKTLENIGGYAFRYTALERVVIPESVVLLGRSAFTYCESLREVEILSEKIGQINTDLFKGCTSLSYVRMPYRLTSIAESAFKDCPNLELYCYVNSYAHKFADEHGIPRTLVSVILYGDLNQDCRITASDALKTLRLSVGSESSDEYMELVGDVSGDGKITASDALMILRYSVGADSSTRVETPV